MPSAASSRYPPAPSGMAAASSPMRTSPGPQGPPRSRGSARAATWMSRFWTTPSASRSSSTSSGSIGCAQLVGEAGAGRRGLHPAGADLGGSRVAGQIGLHQVVRLSEHIELAGGLPVKPAEQGDVRALHGGAESPGAPGSRAAHRRLDQPLADRADRAVLPLDAEPAAPPVPRRLLPHPHDTHDA